MTLPVGVDDLPRHLLAAPGREGARDLAGVELVQRRPAGQHLRVADRVAAEARLDVASRQRLVQEVPLLVAREPGRQLAGPDDDRLRRLVAVAGHAGFVELPDLLGIEAVGGRHQLVAGG